MKTYHKKFHGSLIMIALIMLGTAMLLQNYGSEDLVGMVVGSDQPNNITFYTNSDEYVYEYDESTGLYVYKDSTGTYAYDPDTDVLIGSVKGQTLSEVYAEDPVTGIYNIKLDASTMELIEVSDNQWGVQYTEEIKSEGKTIKISNVELTDEKTKKEGNIIVYDDNNKAIAAYNIIKDEDGTVYLGTTITENGEDVYYYIDVNKEEMCDEAGNCRVYSDKILPLEDIKDELQESGAYKKAVATIESSTEEDIFPIRVAEEKARAEARSKQLSNLASELSKSGITVTEADLDAEEKAINNYMADEYEGDVYYDVTTGHYEGKIGEYGVLYNGDDIGIYVKTETYNGYVYKHKENGKTTYYTCKGGANTCSGKQQEKYDDGSSLRKDFKSAENEVDKVAEEVADKLKDETINLKYKMTVREASYRKGVYEKQAAQTRALISGWLNKWIDNALGGWSKGVPAGICAHIFGLEYYKEDGWVRTAMNASSTELQAQLIANSHTVIIEGEKEEIDTNLYRYAYTLRLLANQTTEWQTYLYNSCDDETSEEVFYDYGALSAGEYYSFHYAGYADQDMIFDCEQE
ncbi:hypothetical protein COV16_04520, partial [Candidatus Woesearchaeota archaeon CG10_big_fil_rev_8_21_14_0_10_34_8]